jgi:exonuclease III
MFTAIFTHIFTHVYTQAEVRIFFSPPFLPYSVAMAPSSVLSIGFINICGQTGLSTAKQVQIESFLVKQKIDILHLQEINICDDSFSSCDTICSSYNIISNNAPSKYGTASLIKTDFIPENTLLDSNGRVIVFNIGPLTLANLYLPSGTDSPSKSSREKYFAETVPQMLLNRLDSGCIGGDLNCIIDSKDCTHHPASKMSPSLTRMVSTFDMKDSYRTLYPRNLVYSHYYHTVQLGEGATRIDRSYSWG